MDGGGVDDVEFGTTKDDGALRDAGGVGEVLVAVDVDRLLVFFELTPAFTSAADCLPTMDRVKVDRKDNRSAKILWLFLIMNFT